MIPHLFSKEPIREITNKDLLQSINLVKHSRSKEEALKRAFKIITSKFKGYRFRTYILFWKAWEKDPNKLWSRSGFMHCTHQNFLLRVLLVKSSWFSEQDIQLGYSLVWYISPHQYLKIKLGKDIICADPWNHRFGVPLGYYAVGFGYKNNK
jgi:hypothetical protein